MVAPGASWETISWTIATASCHERANSGFMMSETLYILSPVFRSSGCPAHL